LVLFWAKKTFPHLSARSEETELHALTRARSNLSTVHQLKLSDCGLVLALTCHRSEIFEQQDGMDRALSAQAAFPRYEAGEWADQHIDGYAVTLARGSWWAAFSLPIIEIFVKSHSWYGVALSDFS